MTTTTAVAFLLACLLAIGIALHFAIRYWRLREDSIGQDQQMAALHGRCDVAVTELAALRDEVSGLAPALTEAQRRWGFRGGPLVAPLVGWVTPEAEAWALLRPSPG